MNECFVFEHAITFCSHDRLWQVMRANSKHESRYLALLPIKGVELLC